MKKTLLAIAALVVSAGAMAAPAPQHTSTQFIHAQDVQSVQYRRHGRKVWVPAHREHGRWVRGHYAWRR